MPLAGLPEMEEIDLELNQHRWQGQNQSPPGDWLLAVGWKG